VVHGRNNNSTPKLLSNTEEESYMPLARYLKNERQDKTRRDEKTRKERRKNSHAELEESGAAYRGDGNTRY
jgi:DUF1680 family protein